MRQVVVSKVAFAQIKKIKIFNFINVKFTRLENSEFYLEMDRL